jgi:hypothetical protein
LEDTMTTEQKIIRAKVGLLELAKQLGNVSQACKMMGCPSSRKRRSVKLGIVEQSQFNRLAESANIGLRKQQVGSALPSRASLF